MRPDDTLSGPEFPVSVSVQGVWIGKVETVSDIVRLFKDAKHVPWGDSIVLMDAGNRPVKMVRGIPFVKV